MAKPIKLEKRIEQLEQNVSDFQRILKQEKMAWSTTTMMVEMVDIWKRRISSIKKEIKTKEKKSQKEDSDDQA